MSYKSATAIEQPVNLSQGYKAVVRALRGPDEDAVQAALLGTRTPKANVVAGEQSTTTLDLTMDSPAQIQETLLRGIVSWTLDGEPGDDVDEHGLLKITAANLAVLTGGDRNLLYVAINNLTDPPGAAEKNA